MIDMVDVIEDSMYPVITKKVDFIVRSHLKNQIKFDFEKLAIIDDYIYN